MRVLDRKGGLIQQGRRNPGSARWSDAKNLRYVIEVRIPGMQNQPVLKHEGCDPEVMGGNGSSLRPELAKGGRVVVRGCVVREENVDATLHQEASKHALVVPGVTAEGEPGAKLSHHDEWKVDTVRVGDDLNGLRHALAEVDVPIRIQRDVHFHIAGSTRS